MSFSGLRARATMASLPSPSDPAATAAAAASSASTLMTDASASAPPAQQATATATTYPPSPSEALAAYFASGVLERRIARVLGYVSGNKRKRMQRSAAALVSALLRCLADALLADPVPANEAALRERIKSVLTGELQEQALSEQSNHLAMFIKQKEPIRVTRTAEFGAKLTMPLVPSACGSPPLALRLRFSVTTVLEYIGTEVVELAHCQMRARGDRSRYVSTRHVAAAVMQDEELRAMAESIGGARMLWSAAEVDVMAPRFPRTQALLTALNRRYSWCHNPLAVPLVLERFLRGELAHGDEQYWRRLFIRPVAYFGRTRASRLMASLTQKFGSAVRDPEPAVSDSENEGPPVHAARRLKLAVHCIAFDLVDAAGREYPLVAERAVDAPARSRVRCFIFPRGQADAGENAAGLVQVRRILGEANSASELALTQAGVDHFAGFEAHEWDADEKARWQSELVSAAAHSPYGLQPPSPPQQQDNSSASAYTIPPLKAELTRWQIETLLCKALTLCDLAPHEASLFQLNQPIAVRRQFTQASLRQSFDSAEVQAAMSGRLHMPNELLGLIGDYAPIELPFLPLVDPSASPSWAASSALQNALSSLPAAIEAARSLLPSCAGSCASSTDAVVSPVASTPPAAEESVSVSVGVLRGEVSLADVALPEAAGVTELLHTTLDDEARSVDLVPLRGERWCNRCTRAIRPHLNSFRCEQCAKGYDLCRGDFAADPNATARSSSSASASAASSEQHAPIATALVHLPSHSFVLVPPKKPRAMPMHDAEEDEEEEEEADEEDDEEEEEDEDEDEEDEEEDDDEEEAEPI